MKNVLFCMKVDKNERAKQEYPNNLTTKFFFIKNSSFGI